MTHKRNRHALRLENLESRQMMAGDVNAFAISRILYVNGDSLDNGVALVDDGLGNIDVVGIDQGGSATTINGGSNQVFTKIKDVVISMGKGNDAVLVSDVFINGNLYISGGKDNDAIGLGEFADPNLFDDAIDSMMGEFSVKKSVVIDGGDGDDTMLAGNTTVTKTLVVSMGYGNDDVIFEAPGGNGVNVLKSASITTGGDDDTVTIDRIAVTKTLSVTTNSGNDSVSLSEVTAKSLNVTLGADDDDVTIADSTITKTGSFNGEKGANDFTDDGGNSFGKLTTKNFQNLV